MTGTETLGGGPRSQRGLDTQDETSPATSRGPLRRWRDASSRARFLTLAAFLLVLALAVRVGYVLHTNNYHPTNDDRSYDHLAKVLAQGHGWAYGTSAYRPPGYPIFLAGVYSLTGLPHDVWTSPRLVEAVVATITVGLIGLIALQVAGRTAMLISLALGAVYLPLVLVGVSLMTESLFGPLMLGAINCALRARTAGHRYRWIVAAGILAGLASLTRGNGIVVAVALAFVVWPSPRLSRRAILAPVVLIVVTALTIMPWTIRNANAQHAFVPVTTELGPTLSGTYNDRSARERYIWNIGGFPNYRAIKNNKKLTGAQVDSQLTSAVISYIGQHPVALPEAMFWNTMRLLDLQGRRVSRMTAHTDVFATPGIADIAVVSFWVLGCLAILGCFTRAARRVPRVLWIVPLVLWLSIAPVTTGTPRFRAALEPFVILLAALGIQAVVAKLARRRSPDRNPRDLLATPVGS